MTEIVGMIEVVIEEAEIEMAAEDLTDTNLQGKEEGTIEVTLKIISKFFWGEIFFISTTDKL